MSISEEAINVINNTKCPVCNNIIRVTKSSDTNIQINHNSLNPKCDEFNRNLIKSFWATIDGNISIEKLKLVAGKRQ